MKLWDKIRQLFGVNSTEQAKTEQTASDEVDYGDRISPPNSLIGKSGGGKWVKPSDPLNSANPFSAFKKDKF